MSVVDAIVPDERLSRYRASPDWIERHIFPGCLIPSRAAIRQALEPTRLGVVDAVSGTSRRLG